MAGKRRRCCVCHCQLNLSSWILALPAAVDAESVYRPPVDPPARAHTLQIGERYELERLLGSGSFSSVCQAVDTLTGEMVTALSHRLSHHDISGSSIAGSISQDRSKPFFGFTITCSVLQRGQHKTCRHIKHGHTCRRTGQKCMAAQ